ncbi:hypothetical protein FACS189499_03340 [Clostridia bacterium]|nr:hypothetical protein FACS189499_03340 [Clostridia bacterium]
MDRVTLIGLFSALEALLEAENCAAVSKVVKDVLREAKIEACENSENT